MQTSNTSKDWDRVDIGAALKKRGTNMRQLSNEHDYSDNAVSNACSRPYPKIEAIIAAALGLTVEDIWPERVARRRARSEKNNNTMCVQAHSTNEVTK